MDKRQQQSTLDTIAAVQLARVVAVGIAIVLAFKGEWAGAGILLGLAGLLWFLLPVTR